MRKLLKGNEAVVLGALAAGCDAFFGYPITPASEISQLSAEYFPRLGKVFLQAECEIGAINMVYGAASCGRRAMTSSSGPGISLKQECVSFLAGGEVPCVIVDIMRAGPGIGNIGPEQSDYNQVVKGGGHGGYKAIVLAPDSVKEMYDFTVKAFDLADKYRTPVYVLADATLGQMMEPIEIREPKSNEPEKSWTLDTTGKSNGNLITSIYLDFDSMEKHSAALAEKYEKIEVTEPLAEADGIDGADIILTGYGITSRILRSVADQAKNAGIKAGFIRPITLWPFPKQKFQEAARQNPEAKFLAVELAVNQFSEDVRAAIPNSPLQSFYRLGGNLPSEAEILKQILY